MTPAQLLLLSEVENPSTKPQGSFDDLQAAAAASRRRSVA